MQNYNLTKKGKEFKDKWIFQVTKAGAVYDYTELGSYKAVIEMLYNEVAGIYPEVTRGKIANTIYEPKTTDENFVDCWVHILEREGYLKEF